MPSSTLPSPACPTSQPALPVRSSRARPIRVCYVIDGLARAGTESQLLALIDHLDRARVQPFLCLLDGEGATSRALEPVDCPIYRLGVKSLHRPRALVQALRFRRILREDQIDIVQVYFPDSTLFAVPVARLAGVRSIVRTRNNLGYSVTRAQRWLGRLYNRLVTVTVANCEACRQAVLQNEGPSPDSIVVLENGVDLARYRICDKPMSLKPARIGMVANLRSVKEPFLFLETARRVHEVHPEVEFQIAGEGELRRELECKIAELGLQDHFHLVGSVADVPAFLSRLQVAVLSSRSEGQSNALLEYMAAGRAIVATAVGGNRELIQPDVNGLLVPPGNPQKLAHAIIQLLEDPAHAARLGAAARQVVEERYSLQARARRFEDFYLQLLTSPKR